MPCDPLTKAGPKGFADRLVRTMITGILDLEPTVESEMKKLHNQKLRREKAEKNVKFDDSSTVETSQNPEPEFCEA